MCTWRPRSIIFSTTSSVTAGMWPVTSTRGSSSMRRWKEATQESTSESRFVQVAEMGFRS